MVPTATPTADANRWLQDATAEAFWDQCRAIPYRHLLADTIAWCEPSQGESWLDLGCGGGALTAALWHASRGTVGRIDAVDCAAANGPVIEKLRRRLIAGPFNQAVMIPDEERIRFTVLDFSQGLAPFGDATFDGIVSGLAISYAEAFDPHSRQYTDAAYTRLFHEMHRVLRPGGRLVFSVNVPRPNYWRIVWKSFGKGLRVGRPLKTLRNVWRMQRHGAWLKREALRGRFHFLPQPAIAARLQEAGFAGWRTKLSYADQAYLIRADKD